ncbi:MAG: TldD/PmbA family protein [Candidatus Lernaella stagnicola]|nr:TldD/PmbA family protein [Candidatus Lernaella stagnicola]
MKKWADLAIAQLAKKNIDYADARAVTTTDQRIMVRGERVEALSESESRGLGIRVLAKGAWGFASTNQLTEAAVTACAERAVDIARASALTTTEPARLDDRLAERGEYTSPRRIDPEEVSRERKIDLLVSACREMERHSDIGSGKAHMQFMRERKVYVDTEGAEIKQDILHSGAALEAIAQGGGDTQRVSYPNSHGGGWGSAGFELIEELNLPGNAGQTAALAAELLAAPECPRGEYDIILAGPQLALQIHESCGHPTELDRALGTEISLAGGSFMTPDRLGSLRYGSEKVNLYGDATIPGALGSFGWDDEGVRAQRFDLVRDGIFVGYQMSRETAAALGLASNGTMRAAGWSRLPLIRMTNINLAPDPRGPSLEELIADTKRGLLMDVNKSWSIDDLRLNFSFSCEYAYLIENGKRTKLLRNPVYVGITPRFWGSCDAVGNEQEWRVIGVPNCGKGQPMQTARVGHGCSAARFRGVTVGGAS